MKYRPFIIDQPTIDSSPTLEQSDLGRNAILTRSGVHILAAQSDDGLVIDDAGHVMYRLSGEYMSWEQYSRRSGLMPM